MRPSGSKRRRSGRRHPRTGIEPGADFTVYGVLSCSEAAVFAKHLDLLAPSTQSQVAFK